MSERLRIGYMPLVDAGLLIAADRLGFMRDEGLDVELIQETSWANLRDKLALGYLDAAHMLAPAAIACSLGLAQIKAPIRSVSLLGLNGNGITLSKSFFAALKAIAEGDIHNPRVSSHALAKEVKARRTLGARAITIAYVFPYSSHHFQLRLWLQSAGLTPDDDVNLVVLPPPLMVSALQEGAIDGFCVGAPWSSIAVERGVGAMIHLGTDIVSACPEKLLAVRSKWADARPALCSALRQAVLRASDWLSGQSARSQLAQWLTAITPDSSAEQIERVLHGELLVEDTGTMRSDPSYIRFDRRALVPQRSQARWLSAQMADAGYCLPESISIPDIEELLGVDPSSSDDPSLTPHNLPANNRT